MKRERFQGVSQANWLGLAVPAAFGAEGLALAERHPVSAGPGEARSNTISDAI
jgi:hypothetical protein